MMSKLIFLALIYSFGWTPWAMAKANAKTYILAISSSESFDKELPALEFPNTDLGRFVKAMEQTGGVAKASIVTVTDASVDKFRKGIAKIKELIDDGVPGVKSKFILYYTGHSDVTGLHLEDALLSKDELHKLISSVDVETRVAFLDSCYSGALAAKGIKPAEEFIVPVAEFDEPTGSVFMAATSGTDLAFEVKELGGSLFTHHIVGGIYGKADANKDELVTIDELYQHVYRQMKLFALALPNASAQKPEYHVNLKGRGALVLSYLADNMVPVSLGDSLSGKLSFSRIGGLQNFQFEKYSGESKRVLLAPGTYNTRIKTDKHIGKGEVTIAAKGKNSLNAEDFTWEKVSQAQLVSKGKRQEHLWQLGTGTQISSYSEIGPHIELSYRTTGLSYKKMTYRLFSIFGAHKGVLDYRGQTGTSQGVELFLGLEAETPLAFGLAGQTVNFGFGGGVERLSQEWDEPEATDDGEFLELEPNISKVGLQVGTRLATDDGYLWGLVARREWLFTKIVGEEDTLAFSASLVSLTFGF